MAARVEISALLCLGLLLGCIPKDVILVADGNRLTVAARDQEIELRMRLFHLANPDSGQLQANQRRMVLLDSAETHFIESIVLLRIANERGLTTTKEEIEEHIRGFSSFFAKLTESDQSLCRAIAHREVLCNKAKKSLESGIDTKISAEELDQALARLKNYADMVTMTNVLIYAHATNVWRKVCGGMDFASAARQYSEAEDCSSCEWGAFPLTAFSSEPQLLHVVETLNIGGYSPPVEGDNGLVIVRLKGIDFSATPKRYELERIFFRLPEKAPEMSGKEVADCLAAEKKRLGLAETLGKLCKAVHVTRKQSYSKNQTRRTR